MKPEGVVVGGGVLVGTVEAGGEVLVVVVLGWGCFFGGAAGFEVVVTVDGTVEVDESVVGAS